MSKHYRKILRILIAFVLSSAILKPYRIQTTYAYGEERGEAHQWLLAKSIEHFEEMRPDVANRIPWELYAPFIEYGIWYADNVYETFPKDSRHCDWTFHDDECDAIHHYGHSDVIESVLGVDIGEPGELPGPVYAQKLYEQAVKFWPGGIKPDLESLPRLWSGNIDNLMNTAEDMGYMYPGGIPFCERTFSTGECPRWPHFASPEDPLNRYPSEDVAVALQYLGWSIHIVQDMTVPFHARNDASTMHREYEQATDRYILEPYYESSLPVAPLRGTYAHPDSQLQLPGYPNRNVTLDYFDKNWSVAEYALEARRISEEVYCWDSTCYLDSVLGVSEEAVLNKEREHLLDTAIKLVAAILEDYFEDLTVPLDRYEPNDEVPNAADLQPGNHNGLTGHTSANPDFYRLEVPTSGTRRLTVAVNFVSELTLADQVVRLVSPDGQLVVRRQVQDRGYRFDVDPAQPGVYLLEVSLSQPGHYEIDFQYSDVQIVGELKSDRQTIATNDMIWFPVTWYAGDFTAAVQGYQQDADVLISWKYSGPGIMQVSPDQMTAHIEVDVQAMERARHFSDQYAVGPDLSIPENELANIVANEEHVYSLNSLGNQHDFTSVANEPKLTAAWLEALSQNWRYSSGEETGVLNVRVSDGEGHWAETAVSFDIAGSYGHPNWDKVIPVVDYETIIWQKYTEPPEPPWESTSGTLPSEFVDDLDEVYVELRTQANLAMGNADIVAQTNARSEIDSILNQIAEMHLPVHPDAIRAVNALQLLASNLSEVIETQASSGNVVELERLIESFWMYGNLRNALTPEQNWIDTVNQIR